MATARTIIRRAMQKAGILSKTEVPSANEANDGLDTLNDLMSSLSNDELMVYASTLEEFTLVPNQATYTIGTGGDFNTSRPVSIVSAYIRNDTVDYELKQISEKNYDLDIGVKTTLSMPDSYSYSNGYPLSALTLYPVPSDSYRIFIRSEKQLSQFTLDAEISLPPGWSQFLVYQLAIMLAPEYGQPIDPVNIDIARMSKASIENQVAVNRSMDRRHIGRISGDILTGYNNR